MPRTRLNTGLLCTLVSAAACDAQNGVLDLSFGVGGIAYYQPVGGAFPIALEASTEGRIAVAGYTWNNGYDSFTTMLTEDGSLESGFGGGLVVTDIGQLDNGASAVVIRPDGRVLTAGYSTDFNEDFALIQYLPDGSPDPAFGDNGTVSTEFSLPDDRARAMALQADGRCVVGGSSSLGTTAFIVARYTTTGELDPTYGDNGTVLLDGIGAVKDMVVQPDGRLLVLAEHPFGLYLNFCVIRLDEDGAMDTSFGTDGIMYGELAPPYGFGGQLALAPDGHIVVAGSMLTGGYTWAMAYLTADGQLETAFADSGWTAIPMQGYDHLLGAEVLSDGRIVLAGDTYDGASPDSHHLALACLFPDGALDVTFGTNGIATADLPEGESVHAVDVDPADRVLCTATTVSGGSPMHAVLRFTTTPYNSLPDAESQGGLLIHPDPVVGNTMTVQCTEAMTGRVQVRMFDDEGRLVRADGAMRQRTGGTWDIDVQGLAPGTYVMEWREADAVRAARFIRAQE